MSHCGHAGLCCNILMTRDRPLGGRHAAVIPALPEEIEPSTNVSSYHMSDREKDRRGMDDLSRSPPYQQSSAHHLSPSPPQPLQAGVTQIVLPAPTSSETLNIQEYHPPVLKESEKRTRSHRHTSHSPNAPAHAHHTRSSSRLSRQESSPSTNQSPYLANAVSASSPPVPATFASILNAYPAPSVSPQPGSLSEFVNGAGSNSSD